MHRKRGDDEVDPGTFSAAPDAESSKDRALFDRLSARLLRLNREAVELAATMRRKPKAS